MHTFKHVQINCAPTHIVYAFNWLRLSDAQRIFESSGSARQVHLDSFLLCLFVFFFFLREKILEVYRKKKVYKIGLIFSDWYEWIERLPYLVHEAASTLLIHVYSMWSPQLVRALKLRLHTIFTEFVWFVFDLLFFFRDFLTAVKSRYWPYGFLHF